MEYTIGDKVSLIIGRPTNLGVEVYIGEEQRDGLLYHNEIFQPLELGQVIDGYIKKIREDGKIDVSLQPQGFQNTIDQHCSILLDQLKKNNGTLKVHDKSSPQDIQQLLNMSKKSFKAAVGHLYKTQKITIKEDGIYLLK